MSNEKFIEEFVAAAKENNEEKMKELAETVSSQGLQERVDLLEALVGKLKEEEANEEVAAGLAATLELMKLAVETQDQENSTVEEAKDKSKAEEATQDVAADNSADESSDDTGADNAEVTTEAKSEGEAPAKEVKAEKSEDK